MGGGARMLQVAFAFLGVALAIVGRLVTLQFGQREFWEREAVLARTRAESIGFRRGAILDRAGRPLASCRTTLHLAFVFSSFRKGAASGALLLARYLLTGERRTVSEVLSRPEPFLDEFASLTLGELAAIEPGQRREDLLWYAAWLAGDESIKEGIARLREGDRAAPAFPRLLEERGAIVQRVAVEGMRLRALARTLKLDDEEQLIERIDAAIAATDARVAKAMGAEVAIARPYERERELHRELDYRDARLVERVAHSAVFDLAADPARLPGLVVREEVRRVYPQEHDVCAALIGRVGPPSREAIAAYEAARDERSLLALEPFTTPEQDARIAELEEILRLDAITPDEEIGKEGLEAAYQSLLRGRRGYRRTENDRSGRVERELEVVAPRAGRDLVLTLDALQQQAAERILRRGLAKQGDAVRRFHPAAFVLLELPTLEVRVLASVPAPSRAELAKEWTRLAADKVARPLHPRAWKPWLPPPPGSSVKPLVAAFALSAGVIGPGTLLECDKDQLRAAGESRPVKCEGYHSSIDVHDALVKSCNHYFARVAAASGSERMVGWFQSVGLGRRSGFTGALLADGTAIPGVSSEVGGTAAREKGGRNLMLLGLGQGKVDSTPLQLAAAIGALALRGYQPPTLIARVGDEVPLRAPREPLPISDAAWETVVEAMRGVTLPGGTASPAHGYDLSGFDLATKTGTPQQAGSDRSHSWLVGFFPSRAPRYAFALFVERTGMHGGDACGPFLVELLNDPQFADVAAIARRSDADTAAARLALTAAGEEGPPEGEESSDETASAPNEDDGVPPEEPFDPALLESGDRAADDGAPAEGGR